MPASSFMAAKPRSAKSKVQSATSLQLDEFFAIEEQIAASARGRAFLRMRDRRAALLGKDDWETSLHDLRDWILQSRAEAEEEAQLGVLRRELMEMAASIRRAKSEIAALRPPDAAPAAGKEAAANKHINLATEELSAIVHATERATSDILNGAERLMEIAGDLRAPDISAAVIADRANQIDAIGMDTMTACGFQDITGQRISKVVNALRYIEERIDGMIRIWGPVVDGDTDDSIPLPPGDSRPDSHLLNGPALKGGMGQSDIDALLADMGKPAKPASAPAPAPEEDPWAAAGLSTAATAKPEPEIDEADWGLPPATPAAVIAAPAAPKLVPPTPKPPALKAVPASTAALDQSAIDSLFA